jgi:hypothetical protein
MELKIYKREKQYYAGNHTKIIIDKHFQKHEIPVCTINYGYSGHAGQIDHLMPI